MIFKKWVLAAGVLGTLCAAAPAFADSCAPIAVAAPMPVPVEVAWGYGRGPVRGGYHGGYGYGYGYGGGWVAPGYGYRRYEGRHGWHPYRGWHRGRW